MNDDVQKKQQLRRRGARDSIRPRTHLGPLPSGAEKSGFVSFNLVVTNLRTLLFQTHINF